MTSKRTSNGYSRSSKHRGFLLDRNLNPRLAWAVGQHSHLPCHTLAAIFGPDGAQKAQDVEIIEYAAAHGLTLLTGDHNLLFVKHEREAILRTGCRVFCISDPQLTRDAKALIIGRHMPQIMLHSTEDGPRFWRLYLRDNVKRDIQPPC
ncbi:MAG: hypothetical protein L0I17_04820 [Actinomycetia bacterium]|nr:hypothetical protein [Actinomycetes bacterium]